jgi:hypothetical protein
MLMSFMKFSTMAFAVLGLHLPANAQSLPTRETPTAGAAARKADITAIGVKYDTKFEDYYLPSSIDATDYPNLVPKGERIVTIAVPTILVAYNWPQQSDRYQRAARLVDHLFSRLDRLQFPGFDPRWKKVNLLAKVPSLERFRPAQEWLDQPQVRAAGPSQ